MLSDAEMNRQQGCCMPSLMEMEMSFAFYTFVLFFSVVASYIRCVINTQMISQTSLISNENIQYDKTTIVVVVFFCYTIYLSIDTIYSIGNNMVVRSRQQQIRWMPIVDRYEYWQMHRGKKHAYVYIFFRY
jgi:hypothetical protein